MHVNFNVPPSEINEGKPWTTIASQTDMDNLLCEPYWAKSAFLPSAVSYGRYAEPLLGLNNFDNIVGIALNGAFIHAATSELQYDAMYPQAYGSHLSPRSVDLDSCLGSS